MKTKATASNPRKKPNGDAAYPLTGSQWAGVYVGHNGVDRSMQYLIRNYRKPIQVVELVAESGMSRRGFIKAFKQHVGNTPGAALRQRRIEEAKRLLLEEDKTLKAIAGQIGFRSENTFCVAFQRAVGIAPKKFQRQVWSAERRPKPR